MDRAGFDDACATLMRLVLQEGRPDALIAIPTGGLHVAEAMAHTVGGRIPILSLTCRRATTPYKQGMAAFKSLVTSLPRPIVDRLRVWEHAVLTRRSRPAAPTGYRFDRDELARLSAWLAAAGGSPSLVVVDDAVDSGATLSQVMDVVHRHAPPGARIRSAAITVTTRQPLVTPHHALYHGQLCRFPWSLDA